MHRYLDLDLDLDKQMNTIKQQNQLFSTLGLKVKRIGQHHIVSITYRVVYRYLRLQQFLLIKWFTVWEFKIDNINNAVITAHFEYPKPPKFRFPLLLITKCCTP